MVTHWMEISQVLCLSWSRWVITCLLFMQHRSNIQHLHFFRSICSFRDYLSLVENHCPPTNIGLKRTTVQQFAKVSQHCPGGFSFWCEENVFSCLSHPNGWNGSLWYHSKRRTQSIVSRQTRTYGGCSMCLLGGQTITTILGTDWNNIGLAGERHWRTRRLSIPNQCPIGKRWMWVVVWRYLHPSPSIASLGTMFGLMNWSWM